ncbi:GCN20 (YFR009W) [Zygosaccharomyces parabailii]|uniref:ZYBA0S13-01288g1_1 n=1 Tax=Zygosaccharomyces bailii (strain CLIB 213 / ATCC 58445 / CBS 680 / BCRC 21525 / NBRC 1098 / NCYC 1416 / NRRL Y-2227) TaxID=1333698 RepID=A0A8J2TB85_ZYGB2|nr:GCN20 (YFR009W) [Zygosaccharomyces parabailii]CDF91688.1 ZYBA0S13-01288g1_1 [Zygosaccharomyces bailii CLIB 213]CDH16797.1 Protein GCN20 [Zygosaccharomyces bailii ISA1307]SJM87649.1 protein GCN20 [Zygosaccharomyces bailii]
MATIGSQVRSAAGSLDPVVTDYAVGYLNHLSSITFDAVQSKQVDLNLEIDFVSKLLVDAGATKEKVQQLRKKVLDRLNQQLEENRAKLELTGDTSKRLLDINVLQSHNSKANIDTSLSMLGVNGDIEHTGRKMDTRVDLKKLAKAEQKIAKKVAKRNNKFVQYEASKLIAPQREEDYDSFFLKINPLDFGSGAGKSKDIHIDTFDLYVGDGQRILSDARLTLSFGHRYGLVGQNGIGKSTLLRALSRRELNVPKHISILHVEQEIRGDETLALQSVLDADVWRKQLLGEESKINERLQEIESLRADFEEGSLEHKKLDNEQADLDNHLQQIAERLVDMESDKAESRAASILYGLGFSQEAQKQPTNSFSGGWRMRLSLARALFCQPDLLLLDEPSNMLDVPSIAYLSEYLKSYPSTILVVSHDRAFLNEVATDIIYQHNERLDYYRGQDFDTFYATKEERRKNAQREYDNQMAYRKHLQEFIDKYRYNAAKSQEAQSRIKKLEKLPVLEPPEEEKSVTFKFPECSKLSPPIIQLQDVTFGYTEDHLLLKDVNLDVQMDSRIALVGANGCGKTTLLKILMEKLTPLKGHLSRNPRINIGYFAQHHVDAMDLNTSAVDWMSKTYPGRSDEEYRRHLGAFGITGSLGLQQMQLLSGGQKSRVAFAALCLNNPHILILDEPSNHLDTAGIDALVNALKNFTGGILMVSHDISVIDSVCNEIWVSENGTARRFEGSIHDYKKYILAAADNSGVVNKQ